MRRTVVVVDILDGCSFRISFGTTVVLDGVTACDPATLAGRQARDRLEEMLLHRHVQMEELRIDELGRSFAKVWADGDELNPTIAALQQKLAASAGLPLPAEARIATDAKAPTDIEVPVDEKIFGGGT
jgi:endonuclease YncB( thermonuclease family)